MCAIGERDPTFDPFAQWGELLDERREREVEEDQTVFGVVDDVRKLLEKQPRIDRVDDGTRPGDAVVELEVAVTVPSERPHTIAGANAQAPQRAGEPPRSHMRIAVRVAVDRTFDRARDDLSIAVVAIGVTEQRRDHQRHVHHQTLHRPLLGIRRPFGLALELTGPHR
jgi:hypothetical protein